MTPEPVLLALCHNASIKRVVSKQCTLGLVIETQEQYFKPHSSISLSVVMTICVEAHRNASSCASPRLNQPPGTGLWKVYHYISFKNFSTLMKETENMNRCSQIRKINIIKMSITQSHL